MDRLDELSFEIEEANKERNRLEQKILSQKKMLARPDESDFTCHVREVNFFIFLIYLFNQSCKLFSHPLFYS